MNYMAVISACGLFLQLFDEMKQQGLQTSGITNNAVISDMNQTTPQQTFQLSADAGQAAGLGLFTQVLSALFSRPFSGAAGQAPGHTAVHSAVGQPTCLSTLQLSGEAGRAAHTSTALQLYAEAGQGTFTWLVAPSEGAVSFSPSLQRPLRISCCSLMVVVELPHL